MKKSLLNKQVQKDLAEMQDKVNAFDTVLEDMRNKREQQSKEWVELDKAVEAVRNLSIFTR